LGIFVHDQVRALQDLGVQITVIAPMPYSPRFLWSNAKWRDYGQVPRKATVDGVTVYYPHTVMLPKSLFFSQYGRFCYQAIQGLVRQINQDTPLDLIHAHVAIPAGHAACLLKARLNVPVVLTIHGLDLVETVHRNSRCRNNVLQAIRQADQTVLVSSKLKERLGALDGLSANKSTVIPNGVDLAKLHKAERTPYPPDHLGRKVLLSVGNLYRRKAHAVVLKALPLILKDYPSVVYRIVGDGPEKNRLQEIVKELDLHDHVSFIGALPHDEALSHMAGCDVFVLPSWNEAFGVVYLEAMGLGKPVIGCRGEGIEDIVDDGRTGYLVEPHSTESLAQTILHLLHNETAGAQVAAAARDQVRSSFTWEQNARKYLDVYWRCITKG